MVFGGYDGLLHAVHAGSGQGLWTLPADGVIHAGVTVGADGTLYVGTLAGEILALNMKQADAQSTGILSDRSTSSGSSSDEL